MRSDRVVRITLPVALFIAGIWPHEVKAGGPANRREFAAALTKIKKGTSKETILRLLGEPDDIRTENEPSGIYVEGAAKIWCWGTEGHLSFPTLGRIYVDRQGNAVHVCSYSRQGAPPDPQLIGERQLRGLLRQIDLLPSPAGEYNPLRMIDVVNALQPLGKDKALAAIGEYLRVADYDDPAVHGIYLLLRVLFDVPEDPGFMPEMSLGALYFVEYPANRRAMPRFPIFLQDDVPFLLTGYGACEGFIGAPFHEVEYFRRVGRVRSRPLTPPDNLVATFEKTTKAMDSILTDEARSKSYMPDVVIMDQILLLLDPVYRKKVDTEAPRGISMIEATEKWIREILADLSQLDVRWDRERNVYVRGDDSRFGS